jgi:hypothetical protein
MAWRAKRETVTIDDVVLEGGNSPDAAYDPDIRAISMQILIRFADPPRGSLSLHATPQIHATITMLQKER